jgi:hypothetical protein
VFQVPVPVVRVLRIIFFAVEVQSLKRKAQFSELFTPPLSKKAKKAAGQQLPKNACVALNEYKPGLVYVCVEQRGELSINSDSFIYAHHHASQHF